MVFFVSGIWPFNQNIFIKDEFTPVVMTVMIINKVYFIENPINNIEDPVNNNIVNSLILKPEKYIFQLVIDLQSSTSTISLYKTK